MSSLYFAVSLQCFDTVGCMTRTASGLQKRALIIQDSHLWNLVQPSVTHDIRLAIQNMKQWLGVDDSRPYLHMKRHIQNVKTAACKQKAAVFLRLLLMTSQPSDFLCICNLLLNLVEVTGNWVSSNSYQLICAHRLKTALSCRFLDKALSLMFSSSMKKQTTYGMVVRRRGLAKSSSEFWFEFLD